MLNLLYITLYGSLDEKQIAYNVMTQSRELTNYCQESVRPSHSRKYAAALNNLDDPLAMEVVVNAVKSDSLSCAYFQNDQLLLKDQLTLPNYMIIMKAIEQKF